MEHEYTVCGTTWKPIVKFEDLSAMYEEKVGDIHLFQDVPNCDLKLAWTWHKEHINHLDSESSSDEKVFPLLRLISMVKQFVIVPEDPSEYHLTLMLGDCVHEEYVTFDRVSRHVEPPQSDFTKFLIPWTANKYSENKDNVDLDEIFKLLYMFSSKSYKHDTLAYYLHKEHGEMRMQAAQAYPIFAAWFAKAKPIEIDKRQPLGPVLKRFNMQKGSLKRLRKIKDGCWIFGNESTEQIQNTRFNINYNETWYDFIQKLGALDTAWVPDNKDNWEALQRVDSTLLSAAESILGLDWSTMVSCSKGNWTEYLKTLSRATQLNEDDLSRDVLCYHTNDMIEFVEDFTRNIMLPQLPDRRLNQTYDVDEFNKWLALAAEILTFRQKNPVAKLLGYTQHWIHRRAELESYKISNQVLDAWAELFPEFIYKDAVRIKPIVTKEGLAAEGRMMNHCIGGYTSSCLSGKSHVFSMRPVNEPQNPTDAQKKDFSTMELGAGKDCTVKINQHRSHRNQNVIKLHKEASDMIVKSINDRSKPDVNWPAVLYRLENPVNDTRDVESQMKLKNLIQVVPEYAKQNNETWMKYIIPGFHTSIFEKNANFNKLAKE